MNEPTVCEMKASRITAATAISPAEVARLATVEATASMQSYFTSESDPVPEELAHAETQEQNQDRIDSIKRSNPKANGRLKPTRQGNP